MAQTTGFYLMVRTGRGRSPNVYLDGSISQMAVHRSEFHSILRREGVEGLVMALNRKVDLLKSVARSSPQAELSRQPSIPLRTKSKMS